MSADPKDLLFGEMVIQMGFVTRETVEESLSAMAASGFGGSLAEYLLQEGRATQAQLDLAAKFMDREPDKLPGQADEQEAEFGRLVEMKRLAATGEVEAAMRLLESMKNSGSYARLGEILMRKTVLTAAQIHQVLEEKGIRILRCLGCGRKAEVEDFDAAKTYRCSACKERMDPVEFNEVPVADAGMDVVVVEEE